MNNNDAQEHPRALTEEDEALLAFIAVCLLFSILMPLVLLLTPEAAVEAPLYISIFIVSLLGPGFTITLKDMRFLLN